MPIRVVLPDGQDIVGRLYARRQLPDGWVYLVSIPVYRNSNEDVEPAEYRMWLRPQDHLRPVEGTSYDSVPTERLEPPSLVQQILGPRRPSGWVLEPLGGRRGPSQAVVHAVDCARSVEYSERCCFIRRTVRLRSAGSVFLGTGPILSDGSHRRGREAERVHRPVLPTDRNSGHD